jgi:hypothetical protein
MISPMSETPDSSRVEPPTGGARGPAVRIRTALALVVIGVMVVALVLALSGKKDPGSPAPLDARERSAESFVASIGVVVHLNYVDTAYGRQADVIARLRELGVSHIRDAMPSPVEPLGIGLKAARQAGIRPTLATGDVATDPEAAVADALKVVPGAVDAFEGPNELDNSGDPGWVSTLTAYMPKLAAAVRRQAPGVPVIGPSFIDPANRGRLPADLPGLGNGHPYPGGGPPEPALAAAARQAERDPGARGFVFTETGYHNALNDSADQPPASEQAAAVYFPRLLLDAFGLGARRTFIYELLDEKPDPGLTDLQQHFGLLRNDFSPKPAFAAIRTLIAAVRHSPGPGEDERLRWTLSGDGSEDVTRLTLVRRDGSRVLALWRPVSVWDREAGRPAPPTPLPVTVRFARPVRDVEVWRPSTSGTPVLRRASARTLPLSLEGDVVLVSLR